MKNTLIVGLMWVSFLAVNAWSSNSFIDPAIPGHTNQVYQVEEPRNKYIYEFQSNISESTYNGERTIVVTSFADHPLVSNDISQTVFSGKSFLPLSYKCSFQYLPDQYYYYKTESWDWPAKKCSIEEVVQHKGKNEANKYCMDWGSDPYLDLSLIYSGLLNGLPIDENNKQVKLKLSMGKYSADVNFKTVATESISSTGKTWECYKIEAAPDLGPLLNWIQIFWGSPKSYVWLTRAYPRLIIKAHIKTPWVERISTLKSISFENGNKS